MPSLEEFFEEAIEQADPVNMVEEEYKYVKHRHSVTEVLHGQPDPLRCRSFSPSPCALRRVVRNSNYGWRALRLLSRRSPHFFQPTNQQFKSLADYLESMVIKLAKELPVSDPHWEHRQS